MHKRAGEMHMPQLGSMKIFFPRYRARKGSLITLAMYAIPGILFAPKVQLTTRVVYFHSWWLTLTMCPRRARVPQVCSPTPGLGLIAARSSCNLVMTGVAVSGLKRGITATTHRLQAMPESNIGRESVLWRRLSRRCAADRIQMGKLALVCELNILV